jgi:hypothetical protein
VSVYLSKELIAQSDPIRIGDGAWKLEVLNNIVADTDPEADVVTFLVYCGAVEWWNSRVTRIFIGHQIGLELVKEPTQVINVIICDIIGIERDRAHVPTVVT